MSLIYWLWSTYRRPTTANYIASANETVG